MEHRLLEVEGITKSFSGVLALDHVSFDVKPGETHVLMGENGAGKSTLMKIINGIYHADEGMIKLEGKEMKAQSPMDAMEKGISMIHQELNNVLDMSVAENIFLGKEYGRGIFYDRRLMQEKAGEVLKRLDLEISPAVKMRELSVAKRQMVEIAKAVSVNAKIIIMDEPTSAISHKEVEALFGIIRNFKKQGMGIVYISHKMDEIFRIADRITILRDGKSVGTYKAGHLTIDQLIAKMVGRSMENMFPPPIEHEPGEEALRVEGLCCEHVLEDISLNIRKGEILGLAGLMGAGRSELAEALFGMRRIKQGKVWIRGKEREIRRPRDAVKAGLAFVTEDRALSGLNKKTSVKKDMSILTLGRYCRWKQVISGRKENAAVDRGIRTLKIKTGSRNQNVGSLSGGNQQKVIVARWLLGEPDILLMDEPTRGIDVGAKYEIYSIIQKLAAEGKAILMISSEMPELIGLCHRVAVMHEGRIRGELTREEMSQEAIMALAAGMEGDCVNRE